MGTLQDLEDSSEDEAKPIGNKAFFSSITFRNSPEQEKLSLFPGKAYQINFLVDKRTLPDLADSVCFKCQGTQFLKL
jgi:hypothetical protein